MKKIKSLLLSLLCFGMVASMPMSVLAEDASGNTDINIETKAATISVTVPSSTGDKGALTFIFNADGTNTLPDNWTITNNSSVDVKLSTVTITGNNGWGLVAAGDASLKETNGKNIHLTLDTKEQTDGVYTLDQTITKNGGTHTIALSVDRSAFSKALTANKAYSAVQAFVYAD